MIPGLRFGQRCHARRGVTATAAIPDVPYQLRLDAESDMIISVVPECTFLLENREYERGYRVAWPSRDGHLWAAGGHVASVAAGARWVGSKWVFRQRGWRRLAIGLTPRIGVPDRRARVGPRDWRSSTS